MRFGKCSDLRRPCGRGRTNLAAVGEQESSDERCPVIPIVLGAIGPRDISDAEAASIATVMGRVLPGVSEASPHSRVAMVTSMAAGTDTVAAQVAHDLGYPVYAVLPLDPDDYAHDFVGDELSLADRVSLAQGVWVNPAPGAASRDARYQACGRVVASLSAILLVAWNGTKPAKPGGTSDTLFYAVPEAAALPDLSGGPPTLTTERGAVAAFAPGDPESLALMAAGMSSMPWGYGTDPVLRRIDEFNRDSGPRSLRLSNVLAVQRAADTLATRFQTRYRRLTMSLLALGVTVIVSVDVQAEISRAWFLGIQLLALVSLLGVWWVMSRSGVKRRFEEYRALAEGARVQEAWQKAGVDAPVADHYLQPLGAEGFWVRRVLRTAWFMDLVQPAFAPQLDPNAARDWIDGQIRYFEGSPSHPGAIRRNEAKAKRLRLLAWAFVAVALLGLVPDVARFVFDVPVDDAVSAGARLAWGVGGAAAAATVAYSQLMGYSRAGKRGRLSLEMYRQARFDVESAGSTATAQQRIVFDLGQEALRETGDWLVMNTTQSVRPV